ncbi:MAG TPA: hypothetical protein VMX38_05255, partial [Verrucomicrobiae bacterium]|nr:hypothetical protein [Verrucomicrobiae bacterium]
HLLKRRIKLPQEAPMTRKLLLLVAFLSSFAVAQQPPVNSPLLGHLTGKWVLDGMIAGKNVTHDVDGEWVLDHHYVRIHEVSREKTDKHKPQYEALIMIGWNEESKQYACAWLDVYGGLSPLSIGIGTPKENEIPFVFKDEKGNVSLTNDFVYEPKRDTWEWRIDNIDNGTAKPFARVKLTRAGS